MQVAIEVSAKSRTIGQTATAEARLLHRAEVILKWWQRSGDAPADAEITGVWKNLVYIKCINETTGDPEEVSVDATGLRNEQLGSELSRRAERIQTNAAEREYRQYVNEAFRKVSVTYPTLGREVFLASSNGTLNALLA